MATDYGALGPWAGAAAAGYDRAHAEKLQRATQNALAGYGQDPDTAVKNFMAVDAPAAIGLQHQLTQQRAAMAAQQEESRKRALGAILGATDMLRKARDTGGDVGMAYDSLDHGGILDTLGMSPQEKAQYRAAITANPALIDIIGQKAAEGVVLAQGAQLRDKNTGRLLGENPMTPKPLVVRRGDGGSDVIYPTPPGGAPGAAPGVAPGGVPTTPGAPLTVETARPLFKAQESSGNYGAVNKDTGALGAYQVMPNTGAAIAKQLGLAWRPDMMTRDDPASVRYQDAIGGAAIKEALNASGGDPRTAFMYYYGGPDRSKWGPKTRQYADEMLARTGGGNRQSAAPQAGGVAYSTPGAPPKPTGHMATPEDYQRFQLDQNVRYWVNADGKPEAISGQDKSQGQLKPVPQQIVSKVIENRNSIRNVDKALAELDKYPGGVGPGTGALGNWFTQLNDPKGNDVRAAIANIGSLIIHDRSGAAVTVSETPRLQPFIPLTTDTAETVKKKLVRLRSEVAAINDDYELQYGPDQGYKPLVGSSSVGEPRPATSAPASNTPGSSQQNPIPIRTAQDAIKNSGKWVKTPDGRVGRAK